MGSTTKQRQAARRNVKAATAAAERDRTIAKLEKRLRAALGRQGSKALEQRRARSR
jgi:hypothetical protein